MGEWRLGSKVKRLADWAVSFWPTVGGGIFLRRLFWRHRFQRCGDNVRFEDRVVVTAHELIQIGSDVSVMSGSYLYAHGGAGLTIGSRTSINHNVTLGAAGGKITIGNDVLIGPNVVIRAADHVFSDLNRPIRDQGHRYGEIVIGDDVWIAANVVVTSGVQIGSHSVVAAGSVVTHDVPAKAIVGGVPARVMASRGSQENEPS